MDKSRFCDWRIGSYYAKAKNGAVNPNLSGLSEQFDWGQYKYGTC